MGLTPVTTLSRRGRPPKVYLDNNIYMIRVGDTIYEFRLTDGLRPIHGTQKLADTPDYSYAREVVKAFIA